MRCECVPVDRDCEAEASWVVSVEGLRTVLACDACKRLIEADEDCPVVSTPLEDGGNVAGPDGWLVGASLIVLGLALFYLLSAGACR